MSEHIPSRNSSISVPLGERRRLSCPPRAPRHRHRRSGSLHARAARPRANAHLRCDPRSRANPRDTQCRERPAARMAPEIMVYGMAVRALAFVVHAGRVSEIKIQIQDERHVRGIIHSFMRGDSVAPHGSEPLFACPRRYACMYVRAARARHSRHSRMLLGTFTADSQLTRGQRSRARVAGSAGTAS